MLKYGPRSADNLVFLFIFCFRAGTLGVGLASAAV